MQDSNGSEPSEKTDERVVRHWESQRQQIASALLKAGADIDAEIQGWGSALTIALVHRHDDFAKWLIQRRASIQVRFDGVIDGPSDQTPLHLCYDRPEIAGILLQNGCDPRAKDGAGRTPIDLLTFRLAKPQSEILLKYHVKLPTEERIALEELLQRIKSESRE